MYLILDLCIFNYFISSVVDNQQLLRIHLLVSPPFTKPGGFCEYVTDELILSILDGNKTFVLPGNNVQD